MIVRSLPARFGDCLLVTWGSPKRAMLTDAGLGKTYTESLRPALVQRRSLGIRRLGLVVVTHIDRDHIGGVEQTLKLQNDHGLARRRQLVEMRVQEKLRVQQASPVHRA